MDEYRINDNNEVVQVITQTVELPVSSDNIQRQIDELTAKLEVIKNLEGEISGTALAEN